MILSTVCVRCRRRLSRAGSGPIDAADGADGSSGILNCGVNPDDPAPDAALTSEGDVDAYRPQERLRPTQVARQRAGIFRPAAKSPRNAVAVPSGASSQEVGGGAGPHAALGHDLPY